MRYVVRRLTMVGGIFLLCFVFASESNASAINDWSSKTKDWVWPAEGIITDTYGTRGGHHKGIDIAAKAGTPIHTVAAGLVTRSYFSDTYGHVVFIQHHNHTETIYAHLSKRLVSEGDLLNAGDTIGEMGNTGDSSGVHLHFEVHENEWTFSKENAIDPFLAFQHNDEDTIPVTGYVPSQNNESYEVKRGDTLWALSEKYNVTVEELMRLNQLSTEELWPKQIIQIPLDAANTYVVKKGDTLENISEKFQTNVKALAELNEIQAEVIYPNQVLIIRKK